jgi:hypothetical protein
MKIAFAGPGLCGKSTAAEYLEREYGGARLSFAAALKQNAYEYGWDGKKDDRGRKFLQELGRVVREYNPEYWVEQAALPMHTNIYLDDLRFENEVAVLKNNGFVIVYIQPFGLSDVDAEWRKDPSEQFNPEWADITIASHIGNLHDFKLTLDALVKLIEDGEFDDDDILVD